MANLPACLGSSRLGRASRRSGTREAYAEHERARTELKALVPEDAKEASGHGIRARRSKAGAISFDVLEPEVAHAPVQ